MALVLLPPPLWYLQRRKEMKHELGLPEDYGIHDSDSEQGEAAQYAAAHVVPVWGLIEQQEASRAASSSCTNSSSSSLLQRC
jgi:hypothetical protein